MPKQDLDRKAIDELLSKVKLGHLGTVDSDGRPYIIPLGFRYVDGTIYIHVADKGDKINNIRGRPSVCIEVTDLDPTSSMLRSESWGDFASVVVKGEAERVEDEAEKVKVYGEAGWGSVYRIKPEEITGRAWKK